MANPEQSNQEDLRDMATEWYGTNRAASPGFMQMWMMQKRQNEKRLVNSLKQHEGFRAKPYTLKKDKDTGVQTVGYGTRNNPTTNRSLVVQGIEPKDVWAGKRSLTEQEALQILSAHVNVTKGEFKTHYERMGVDWKKIPSRMKNSLVNMGYQMGATNVVNNFPGMVAAVGRGDQQRAYDESLYVVGNPDSPKYRQQSSKWVDQTPNRARAVSQGYLEKEVSPLRNMLSLRGQSPKPRRVE